MKWQPIATVPKDGTVVDLWSKYGRSPDCRYMDRTDEGDSLSGWEQKYQETADCYFWMGPEEELTYTHWMIVEPPEESTSDTANPGN